MTAITLHQPWATLVAIGAKRYETRSWYTKYRGPLAIHSSLEFPQSARALCRCEPFCEALAGSVDLPLGCIVAIAELVEIASTTEDGLLVGVMPEWPAQETAFGDFSPGRYAWLLKNVRALQTPIPARGARSLWEWNESDLGLLAENNKVKQKKTTQFRQGDVLIERVTELPNNLAAREKENGRVILAHGEVTGHAHEIEKPKLATLRECNDAVRLLGDLDDSASMTQAALIVNKDTAVVHQEHSRIPLEKGDYIVRRQREYSPREIRNVAD